MFNYQTYADLLRYDPIQAEEYRKKTVPGVEEKIELSADDLKKLLKEKGVTFFAGAKIEKLVELCKENSLI